MKKYFLHDGSKQEGPFDIEELKSKKLNRDTPIWFEGLDEWTTIGKVEELKGVITSIPPPFAQNTSPPKSPPIQNKFVKETSKQSNSIGRQLQIGGGIVLLLLTIIFVYKKIERQQYLENIQNEINKEEAIKASFRNNITSYVIAERSRYMYSDLGGISNLEIYVTNKSDYLIDNVKVRVIYIKANGEVWDSRIIDFNLLEPQTKTTIKMPDTVRGTSVQYEIVSIKSNALGLL